MRRGEWGVWAAVPPRRGYVRPEPGRIAAHIVFFSVADAMVVSSMTNEGNVWLGLQGNPQKALMTLHRF